MPSRNEGRADPTSTSQVIWRPVAIVRRRKGSMTSSNRRLRSSVVSLAAKESPGPARSPRSTSKPRYAAPPTKRSKPKSRSDTAGINTTRARRGVSRHNGSRSAKTMTSLVYTVRALRAPICRPLPVRVARASWMWGPRGAESSGVKSASCARDGSVARISTSSGTRLDSLPILHSAPVGFGRSLC